MNQNELLTEAHAQEVDSGQRFQFGRNWSLFLNSLNDAQIGRAEESLREMLNVDSLRGSSFIDIGSGSGLFSLAARRLGARVYSFDYDPYSFASTAELRSRYFPEDGEWQVKQGSVLDKEYLESLGQFDIVYSWGVLHHTGSMWQALENVAPIVKPGGTLFIAIYNDQGKRSRRWRSVKRAYNKLPPNLRFLVLWPAFLQMWWKRLLKDALRGRPAPFLSELQGRSRNVIVARRGRLGRRVSLRSGQTRTNLRFLLQTRIRADPHDDAGGRPRM